MNKQSNSEKKSEVRIQNAVVRWLRARPDKPLFCATVGGVNCTVAARTQMRQSGYELGVPDLLIYEARHGCHGFAIEFKTQRGVATHWQKEWLQRLAEKGWRAEIFRSAEDAIEALERYFSSELYFSNAGEKPETQ